MNEQSDSLGLRAANLIEKSRRHAAIRARRSRLSARSAGFLFQGENPMLLSAVRRVRFRRPSLESLESRALLSTVHLLVNTLADDPTGPVADWTTLRDAITAADAGSATNKYVIKFAVDGTIALSAQLPALTGNIDIKGPGAGNLTVQGGGVSNQFSVFTTIGESNISEMTISDGYSPGGGGGIDNYGNLSLSNLVVANCYARFGGGGINNNGTLNVLNSIFYEDTCDDNGGAIENNEFFGVGACTIKDSFFIDNSVLGNGGAIENYGSSMTLTNSIFVGNTADSGTAGAIMNFASQGMTVSRCAFLGNSAYFDGAISSDQSLNLASSFFLDNVDGQ